MTWRLDIENIGGIRSGAATIEPGVNAVRASNWQGKSSLIAAIEIAMGSDGTLTEGADRGRVELQTDDDTYVIELARQETGVISEGGTYLTDEPARVRAELFAFLDEDNDVRRAVRDRENLEAVLTRPLDFERIDERIADLTAEREQVEAEYERAEAAAERLPNAQDRVNGLESELEELRAERDELKGAGSDAEPSAEREALSDTRAERDRLETRKTQLESTIERTRERLESRRDELAEVSVPDAGDLEADLVEAREAVAALEQEVDLLQSLYNANKRVLDEGRLDLLTEVDRGLAGDSFTCWVCGGPAERSAVEARLESMADRVAEKRQAAADRRTTVQEIEEERRSIRERRRERQDLESEIDELESTLAEREESLDTVSDRLDEVTGRVEALEAEAQVANDRLTDLESEIKLTEAELADAREELETIEARADNRATLEDERESLTAEIEELRTRKDRLKRDTREAFDEAIRRLIDDLAPGFEHARLTSDFDLVAAREGREASLAALSEGEVELLGIVAALAGYEAFDVAADVPIILLDSVGDLAGENLARLVRYLGDHATYVVTTAYPEQSVDEDNVIDPTGWSVVSQDLRPDASS